jgi:lipoprotein-releasing system ATP-binding protein
MNDQSGRAPTPALRLDSIGRVYTQGHRTIDVFKQLSLSVYSGEVVALVGQSGTGKSSLLHIAGLLERPTAGDVYIAGENCTQLDDNAMTRVRRLGIGFVYQFHHLLPEFSAVENIVMPQLIAGASKADAEARARHLLDRLGLTKRADHRPAELSGGEQQRVAIARALANRPLLLLADEPTGNLDPETAGRVHGEFLALIRDEGLAALIATHNLELARSMSRVVQLHGGQLVEI